MAIVVQIPTALRGFTDRKSEVLVEGTTVGEAIRALADEYPDIRQHLYQSGEAVELRSFINVFLGEVNIKKLQGLGTPVAEGNTVMLVPAIAGGRG
jgi:adenylyltransferase/sulfurtransferase